jgi:Pup amidohydrolase
VRLSPRFVGVETEYGIAITGPRDVHPVKASSMIVDAYRHLVEQGEGVRWDFTDERPERDMRYSPVAPSPHDLELELIADEFGMSNTVLTNGARFYVDHAHPEYATPECSSAIDVLTFDIAGERIMERAAALVVEALPDGSAVHVHKNNTDGKVAAYGTHENYLVDRTVPFGWLTRHLLPMFISRPVLVGAGRIGALRDDHLPFQLTQRADFFEAEVGLETTVRRPIMNTRDEPHADPERFRRLHVINGDANLCEVAGLVKVGAMLLVLDAIEEDRFGAPLDLVDPVRDFRAVSHDLAFGPVIETADGRWLGAVDVQEYYFERCRDMVDREGHRAGSELVLFWWERMLAAARLGPEALVGLADWATKLQLIDAFRGRHGLPATHDRVRMIDLQYHDVRRDKGLYHRLASAGRVERLVDEAAIAQAISTPPADTRAWFRGEAIRLFPGAIVAAGWDSLVLDVGGPSLVRLPMNDPALGTRALTGAALEAASDINDLLERLGVREDLPGQLA